MASAQGEQHPIEAVGRELRGMMSWVKSGDDDYTEGASTLDAPPPATTRAESPVRFSVPPGPTDRASLDAPPSVPVSEPKTNFDGLPFVVPVEDPGADLPTSQFQMPDLDEGTADLLPVVDEAPEQLVPRVPFSGPRDWAEDHRPDPAEREDCRCAPPSAGLLLFEFQAAFRPRSGLQLRT